MTKSTRSSVRWLLRLFFVARLVWVGFLALLAYRSIQLVALLTPHLPATLCQFDLRACAIVAASALMVITALVSTGAVVYNLLDMFATPRNGEDR